MTNNIATVIAASTEANLFVQTPTENDEGRLSSNGADSSSALDDSSSALPSSSDGSSYQSTLNFDPKTRHFRSRF